MLLRALVYGRPKHALFVSKAGEAGPPRRVLARGQPKDFVVSFFARSSVRHMLPALADGLIDFPRHAMRTVVVFAALHFCLRGLLPLPTFPPVVTLAVSRHVGLFKRYQPHDPCRKVVVGMSRAVRCCGVRRHREKAKENVGGHIAANSWRRCAIGNCQHGMQLLAQGCSRTDLVLAAVGGSC